MASLIAVFLALALGILVGGEVLHATVVHDLRAEAAQGRSSSEAAEQASLLDRSARQRSDAALAAAAPMLLGDRLRGRAVALVSLPGVDDAVRGAVADALRSAQASLVGDVRLADLAVDPTVAQLVADVSARLRRPTPGRSGPTASAPPPAPPGTPAPDTPAAGAPGDPAAQLSDVLADAVSAPSAARVVPALRAARLLQVGSRIDGPATALVVLAAGGAARGDEKALLIALASAAAARGAAVAVTAPLSAAAAGGALAALRADPVGGRVSSVDGADTPAGPLTTVLALVAQGLGRPGQYGTGPGATAVLPALG